MQVTSIENKEGVGAVKNKYDFDIYYAEAWSRKQGHFSFTLANNLMKYLDDNHIYVKSVLDVCSGSGEFISIMRNACQDCMGIDNADGYLNYVKTRYNDIKFEKVENLYEFNLKRKFHLITCNHDVVNMFTEWWQWEAFFKTAYKHLTKNGILMFDFYTQKKLEGWKDTIFEQGNGLDYVSRVTQNNSFTVMNETYYLKETNTLSHKTGDVMVECWFETDRILNALRMCGFKSVKTVDINLKEIADLNNCDRIHIIATK